MRKISVYQTLSSLLIVCNTLHAGQLQLTKKQKISHAIEYPENAEFAVTIHLDTPMHTRQIVLQKDDLYTVMQKRLKSALRCCILSLEDDACKVRECLQFGVEKETKNDLLRLAISQGKKNTAWMLLYYGADIKARNKYNNSPLLHSAVMAHYTRDCNVIHLLLIKGASVRSKDRFNQNPLELALRMHRHAFYQLYKQRCAQSAIQLALHHPCLPLEYAQDWQLLTEILQGWVAWVKQTMINESSADSVASLADISAIPLDIMEYLFWLPEHLYKKTAGSKNICLPAVLN